LAGDTFWGMRMFRTSLACLANTRLSAIALQLLAKLKFFA
jgi:hypothetical protein